MAKKIDKIDKRKILIAKEKHATRHFDASTEKKLHAAALTLVKERIDPQYGYIQNPGPMEEWIHTSEDFTDEQIAALPKSLRKDAESNRNSFRQQKREWERAKKDFEDAHLAVRKRDGKLATDVLFRRRDYEYEKVEFEYLE